ncbi:MAG: hypothetical protein IT259_05070 [Saprospiraceae bacterium]|nr:hypothetical protein [Saprospiraceae bacterium]
MRKPVYFGIFLCLIFSAQLAQAQGAATAGESPAKFRKNIFVEGLGNGLILSANYDMRLKRGVNDGLGFRAGIGGGGLEGTASNGDYISANFITIPVSINYLVGKRRSFFEAGLGITPIYVNADLAVIDNEFYSGKGWGAAGFINMGYRFQPLRNNVMFRLDWTPAITSEGFFAGFFGVSLGYSFL